jgi:hypothetical protein
MTTNENGDGKRQPTELAIPRGENETGGSLAALFGEPPLLAGESKEAYWQLYAAIQADVKPKTIFEKMLVRTRPTNIGRNNG